MVFLVSYEFDLFVVIHVSGQPTRSNPSPTTGPEKSAFQPPQIPPKVAVRAPENAIQRKKENKYLQYDKKSDHKVVVLLGKG